MAQNLSLFLILIGALFMLVAALGVARMPDLLTRMHCSTKSATLGVGCIMVGVALYFGEFAVGARALAVVAFLLVTAPVAAHMIGRAAYFAGVSLWEGTLSDELRGRYDVATHSLAGPAPAAEPEQETGPPPA